MREKIAKMRVVVDATTNDGFRLASQSINEILALITEEIEKGLLTDEELGEIIRINHDDRPFKSESAIARGTRQAQLDKILSLLKE